MNRKQWFINALEARLLVSFGKGALDLIEKLFHMIGSHTGENGAELLYMIVQ